MKLSVLIVDDELMARRRLKRFLATIPDLAVVSECATGAAAVAALREQTVDAMFLDGRAKGGRAKGVWGELKGSGLNICD
jgi:DNA-binding NarL/FixJ family response regulator